MVAWAAAEEADFLWEARQQLRDIIAQEAEDAEHRRDYEPREGSDEA